jgi:hypothetical protein
MPCKYYVRVIRMYAGDAEGCSEVMTKGKYLGIHLRNKLANTV